MKSTKNVGLVTSSGFGDCYYSYYTRKNKDGDIDGVYVRFITPEIKKKMEPLFAAYYNNKH